MYKDAIGYSHIQNNKYYLIKIDNYLIKDY